MNRPSVLPSYTPQNDAGLATDLLLGFAPTILMVRGYTHSHVYISWLFLFLGLLAIPAVVIIQRKQKLLGVQAMKMFENTTTTNIILNVSGPTRSERPQSNSAIIAPAVHCKGRGNKLLPSDRQLVREKSAESTPRSSLGSPMNLLGEKKIVDTSNGEVMEEIEAGLVGPRRKSNEVSSPVVIKDVAGGNWDFDSAKEVAMNSREPVPFDSEVFKGVVLVKLRTDPMDPYYAPYFEGKQRYYEFQIQGRFKRPMAPEEKLMFGMELPNAEFSVGLVARSILRMMLSLCQRIVTGVHYSFGDKKTQELPHVVFPIESTIDRLIITPDGEEPPKLGVDMLPEPIDKKTRSAMNVCGDMHHTYTISIHGMYIDFCTWNMVNFPGLRSVGISSLIGDSGVRLIGYCVNRDHKGQHSQDVKKYFFGLQITQRSTYTYNQSEDTVSILSGMSQSNISTNMVVAECGRMVNTIKEDEECVSEMYQHSLGLSERDENDIVEVSCPCYLMGATTGRGWLFAIKIVDSEGHSKAVLRPFKSLQNLAALHEKLHGKSLEIPKLPSPPRLGLLSTALPNMAQGTDIYAQTTTLEHMREAINQYLKRLLATPDGPKTLRSFVETKMELPTTLLTGDRRMDFGILVYQHKASYVCMEGPVAIAAWDSRWIEDWAVLSTTELCLYAGGQAHRAERVISLAEVIEIKTMDINPFPGAFLEIHTIGRVFYLAMISEEDRDLWLAKLQAQVATVQAGKEMVVAVPADPDVAYMVKSKRRWGSERHVLNERRIFFEPIKLVASDPCALMASVLETILNLPIDYTTDQVVKYFDLCSQLKCITIESLESLGEDQRKAFFLNMYHCLVAHTLLVSGPPQSSRKIDVLYDITSFECANTVFSMAEIEHCILRQSMPRPKRTSSKFKMPPKFLPDDPRLSLGFTKEDPRLCLVLNWGGVMCGGQVPVYSTNPVTLNNQMDTVCRQFLFDNLKVDSSKKRISLPLVCQRFSLDFGNDIQKVCDQVLQFASPEQRLAAVKLLAQGVKDKTIRYPKKNQWKFVRRLGLLPLGERKGSNTEVEVDGRQSV